MKIKLIKEKDVKMSTIEHILTNRNIDIDKIKEYLNSTDSVINSPEMLGKKTLKDAAAALTVAIRENHSAIVVVDSDCDGFTSAALIINYLYDTFPSWVVNNLTWFMHEGKQHGLNDCTDLILASDCKLVICPDSASNDYEEHKKLKDSGVQVLVLDHHEADKVSDDAIVINNQLSDYPNKNFAGVGVTWQFCRFLDELLKKDYASEYLDLSALGNCADMMDTRSFETKYLIDKGFKKENIKNPFVYGMADKNSFKLGDGDLTFMGAAFYIAPFVNAMVRSGTMEEKMLLFSSMLKFKAFEQVPSTKRGHSFGETERVIDQALRAVTNVKNRQTKAQNTALDFFDNKIKNENLLEHKVLLLLLEPGQVDKNIAG